MLYHCSIMVIIVWWDDTYFMPWLLDCSILTTWSLLILNQQMPSNVLMIFVVFGYSEINCNMGVMHAEKATKLHQILLLLLSQRLFYKIRKYKLLLFDFLHAFTSFLYIILFFFIVVVLLWSWWHQNERTTCNNLQNQHQ